MFQKPFRIKTQSALKNSDRKKLRADMRSQYPALSEEGAALLIPNKDEMNNTKVSTSGGQIIQIYFVKKNPIIFESYKTLYPSVYALWQVPDLIQAFRTWPPVIEKLQKGADLMLPGVIYDKEPSLKMFGNLQKGDTVCVTIAGNRSPVALGQTLLSGEDMYLSGLKGKGVGVLHIVGDALWEAGDKSLPPSIPEPLPSDPEEGEGANGGIGAENGAQAKMPNMDDLKIEGEPSNEGKSSVAEGNGEDINEDEEEDDDEDERDPAAEMDELLHFCFACALKGRIKSSDLPLITVNLMRDFMQPFSPAKRLDVKKSSFKKLSKFLQKKVSDGYITVKQQMKGVDTITTIDKSHPDLRGLDVPEAVEEESPTEVVVTEEEVNKPLTFKDVYCVNAVTSDLFKGARVSKGAALIISDVREIVTNYIKDNGLQRPNDPKEVILDPILAHTILKPSEGDLDHMPWEQVINRVVGKMQPGVAISSSEGLLTIKKGKMEPIKLDVMQRASNKKVTTVDNLEEYAIDVKAFARTVQKAVACSCSVVMSEQKNKGPQVIVQGNQITFIGNMLIDKCKIPAKYVVGLDKAPKQKKKR